MFTLIIPEPKIRKKQAPTTKVFKSKVAYTRKAKHKKGVVNEG